MPYMSPAAIGLIAVRPRGAPSVANRSPMARKVASGQPRPLDEEMVTVAPSWMRSAASSNEMCLLVAIVSS
jgi:hypothetical protein